MAVLCRLFLLQPIKQTSQINTQMSPKAKADSLHGWLQEPFEVGSLIGLWLSCWGASKLKIPWGWQGKSWGLVLGPCSCSFTSPLPPGLGSLHWALVCKARLSQEGFLSRVSPAQMFHSAAGKICWCKPVSLEVYFQHKIRSAALLPTDSLSSWLSSSQWSWCGRYRQPSACWWQQHARQVVLVLAQKITLDNNIQYNYIEYAGLPT